MKRILVVCACLAALVALASCALINGSVEYPLTLELKHGASRTVNSDLRIRFASLIDDSRCPVGAQCPWEGNAEIMLELSGSGDKTVRLNTGLQFPRTEQYQGYTVTLQALKPHLADGQSVDASAYVAVLSIDKAVPISN